MPLPPQLTFITNFVEKIIGDAFERVKLSEHSNIASRLHL